MTEERINILFTFTGLTGCGIQTFLYSYLQVPECLTVEIPLQVELTLIPYALHLGDTVHTDLALIEAQEPLIFA